MRVCTSMCVRQCVYMSVYMTVHVCLWAPVSVHLYACVCADYDCPVCVCVQSSRL